MLLSAVIITYNEEQNIGRCLQSLMGIADEIIVVDSASTDKTCSIGAVSYTHLDVYKRQTKNHVE